MQICLANLLTVDIELACAREFPGFDEVELQLGHAPPDSAGAILNVWEGKTMQQNTHLLFVSVLCAALLMVKA